LTQREAGNAEYGKGKPGAERGPEQDLALRVNRATTKAEEATKEPDYAEDK
jgi:hypothetical protein